MKQIIFFSASWCHPCKSFKPVMERLSQELPIRFVDVDTEPQLVAEYGIRNVPSVVVTQDGREISKRSGVLTESQVRELFM
jgi:putative thioredoxin